jgi:competence ComEA-like helix-hairpin-helix protein
MKQSLASGRSLTLIVAFVAFTFWLTACSRLPRSYIADATPGETATSATKAAPINLNTASPAELEKLPGVGRILAERIITYRNEHGAFRRAEHLMMVRGISERKFRELRSLVRVE